jgi:hypothetical protein
LTEIRASFQVASDTAVPFIINSLMYPGIEVPVYIRELSYTRVAIVLIASLPSMIAGMGMAGLVGFSAGSGTCVAVLCGLRKHANATRPWSRH